MSKSFFIKCACCVLSLLLPEVVLSASDEQWKKDQAAGIYWYVGRGGIFTHDPYDNNPGTLVVIPSPENNEIRIYPDIPFSDEGETRVRYAFEITPEKAGSSFELWPTTFERGVFGYVEVPQEFTTTFIEEARAEGSVILDIADRNGDLATRTFIFDGYDEVYAELPDSVRILPPPNENGLYDITFNVEPGSASVTILDEDYCVTLLACREVEVGKGTGASFTLNLPSGNYYYIKQIA